MDVQLLNWLDCTAPYFDWPLSTRPLYSNTHQKLIYREPRVDVKVQRYRNLFSSRTGQHGSSHWPLPLRRWLIGQTTWSDRYSMCFDKPWPKPNCFICYTSRSPDARYIDVSVKKIGYLLEWGYKKVSRPNPASAENTEIITEKATQSIPSELSLKYSFTQAIWIIPV